MVSLSASGHQALSKHRAKTWLVPIAIFCSGALLSTWAWTEGRRLEEARDDTDLSSFSALASSNLEERVSHGLLLLKAFQSAFVSTGSVSRQQFHRLFAELRVHALFPEAQAVQWARYVPSNQRHQFESKVRSDNSLEPLGYPDFRIHPEGVRADHVAVEYNEPMQGNERAFGHDNMAEAARREQTERARDSGQPVASPPLRLLQGGMGYIVRLPIYKPGLTLDSLEDRRRAYLGQINGVFTASALLRTLADVPQSNRYRIEVTDEGPVEPAFDSPLQASVQLALSAGQIAALNFAEVRPVDRQQLSFGVAGRQWKLSVTRSPVDHRWTPLPLTLLLGGLGLSALLSTLAALHQRQAFALIRLSERMRSEAQVAVQRLDAIIDNTADGIVTVDNTGVVLAISGAAEAMFGLSRQQAIGQHLGTLLPDLARHSTTKSLAALHDEHAELVRRHQLQAARADGTPFAVELNAAAVWVRGARQVVCSLRDLTEAKAADEAIAMTMHELAQATELQETMLRYAAFAIVLTDAEGVVRAFNPAAEQLLQHPAADVVNQVSFDRFFHAEEMTALTAAWSESCGRLVQPGMPFLMASLGSQPSIEHELELRRGDGQRIAVSLTVTALRDEQGQITALLMIAYDVTARRQMVAEMTQMAYTDRLTGLANRGQFERELRRALLEARRRQTELALLFIDLDRFKPINDTHGHAMGDRVLCEVAQRLKAATRTADVVARLGGDEFVVLLPALNVTSGCEVVAEKILQALCEPMVIDGLLLRVGASIGVVTYPDGGDDAETLIHKADLAMYQAKQAGRNCFRMAHVAPPSGEC